MSLDLSREVWDHAPEELTPAELVVLLAIAEGAQAHDRTDKIGRFWPARTWGGDFQARARMTPDGLRRVLQRLAKRGLECRVPVKYRESPAGPVPVYAYKGTATTYRLPDLTKAGRESRLSADQRRDQSPDSESSRQPHAGARAVIAGTTVRERRDEEPSMPGRESRPKEKNPKEPVSAGRCDVHDELMAAGTCPECELEAQEQWDFYGQGAIA
jgi:hypothetical protein